MAAAAEHIARLGCETHLLDKGASVGNSSLAETFAAPRRINSDANAVRLIGYREACSVTSRAFMLGWANCRLFHVSPLKAASGNAKVLQVSQWKSGPYSLRKTLKRLGIDRTVGIRSPSSCKKVTMPALLQELHRSFSAH
jgi:hypothetical protein